LRHPNISYKPYGRNYNEAVKKRAIERLEKIEEEKVRLRIAKVEQLHRKRVSTNGIAEALGLSIPQVESDLDYIERSMSQAIATHIANINNNNDIDDIPTTAEEEYEKRRRKFLIYHQQG
jgi:hypothetical protein